MKKIFAAIAVAVTAFVGITAAAPANAAPANQTTEAFEYGPLNGHSFLGRGICLLDKTGTNAWRIGDVGNTAESGSTLLVTGYRTTHCNEYGASQTLTFHVYNLNDGKCGKITGDEYPRVGAQHSTHYWWANATVWINASAPSGCRATETDRMNSVGKLMGYMFGLDSYYDIGNNDALMNDAFDSARGFWAKDRNGLYVKYVII